MSRGWKKDIEVTKAAHFMDSRSFVSLDGHFLLHGDDKREMRSVIYQRANGKCEVCGQPAPWNGFNGGSWRHMLNAHNHGKRCDCPEGGMWAHLQTCHMQLDHPGPQWSKNAPQTSD